MLNNVIAIKLDGQREHLAGILVSDLGPNLPYLGLPGTVEPCRTPIWTEQAYKDAEWLPLITYGCG